MFGWLRNSLARKPRRRSFAPCTCRFTSAAATTRRSPPTRTAGTGPTPICSRPAPPTTPRSAASSATGPATRWPTTATPAGSCSPWPTTRRHRPAAPDAHRRRRGQPPGRAGVLRWADGVEPAREAPHHADGPGRRTARPSACWWPTPRSTRRSSSTCGSSRPTRWPRRTWPASAPSQRHRRDRLRRLRQPGRVPPPQEPPGRRPRPVLAWTTTACRPTR